MKRTRIFILSLLAVVSFSAFAGPMENCNTLPTQGSRNECKYSEQRAVAMDINRRSERIVLNPGIYGAATSTKQRGVAPVEFDRIKAMCRGNNDCLFNEYTAWKNELVALMNKKEGGWPKVVQVSNDRSGRQLDASPPVQRKTGRDPLDSIPAWNSDNERGD